MIKPTLEEERVLDLCEKIEKFMNDNIGLCEWGFWLPFVFVAHRPIRLLGLYILVCASF